MRIGIDIRELEKNKMTGIARFIENFLSYAVNYDQKNQYILFGNQKTCCRVKSENVMVKVIPEFNKFYWDQIVLASQIKKENIDVFFSPYHKCPIFSPVKKVITVHDIYPFLITGFDSRFKMLLKRRYYDLMFSRADKIISVTQYTKQKMLELSAVSAGKIEVVYNSVGEEFRSLDKQLCQEKVREAFGVNAGFILYVGNFKPHKNLNTLVRAYNALDCGLKEKFQLVIAAKKDEFFPGFYRWVKDLDLERSVIFTDLVESADLVSLYNAASLYISISLCEGFGLPFIEAMACATPVIAADSTAISEVVRDAAILVEPCDAAAVTLAIKKVLSDLNLRDSLIAKGLRRCADFSLNAQGRKIVEVLEGFRHDF